MGSNPTPRTKDNGKIRAETREACVMQELRLSAIRSGIVPWQTRLCSEIHGDRVQSVRIRWASFILRGRQGLADFGESPEIGEGNMEESLGWRTLASREVSVDPPFGFETVSVWALVWVSLAIQGRERASKDASKKVESPIKSVII